MNTPYSRAPHAGSQGWSTQDSSPHAALLIDFDNVTMGRGSNLSSELKALLNSDIIKGKVAVQRAYADWRRYPQYIVPLSEASIDLIFAPAYGSSKKNATDIRMAIDALELVFVRPEIGTFILLTGDSDFSSVVLKLKEYGKYVIGVGIQESSSDILVQNCDEYYSYTALTGLTRTDEAERVQFDPWVLVGKAVERMEERSDVMRSDRLKQVMREIDPGFDEGEHGFSKFSRFLAEAASRGLVELKRMDNGQYEVSAGGGGAAGTARSRAGTPATAEHESPIEHAFELLRVALGELTSDGRSPARDSDVKRRILVLEPAFDEAELGFSKFSRFLAQAEESSIVELRRKEPEGYTEVLLKPVGEEGTRAAGGRRAASRPTRETGRSGRRNGGRSRRERVTDEPGRSGRENGGRSRSEPVAEDPIRPRGRRTRPRRTEEPAARAGGDDQDDADSAGTAAREPRQRQGKSRDAQREAGAPAAGRSRRGARDKREKTEESEDGRGRRGARRGRRSRPEPELETELETEPADSRSSDTGAADPEIDAPTVAPDVIPSGEYAASEPSESPPRFRKEEAPEPKLGRGLADDMPVIRAVTRESEPESSSQRRSLHPRQQRRRRGAEGPPPILAGQSVPTVGGPAGADADAVPAPGAPRDGQAPADVFRPGRGVIDPEALGLPTEPGSIKRYLTSRYKGVGERTAESLVEHFGDEVFEVLHSQPRRVADVLPEGRAAQLIEAWREDLARRSAGEDES